MQTLEEDDGLKLYAAATVRDAGLPEHRQQLAGIINTYQSLSSHLCGVVCQALYPHAIDANELVRLLEKTEPVPNSSKNLPYVIGELMKSVAPETDLEILLTHFNRLLVEPPLILFDKQPISLSARYVWLGKSLGELIKRILQQSVLDEKVIQKLVQAFESLKWHNRISSLLDETVSLSAEFKEHSVLRRAYLWRTIQLFKISHPNTIPSLRNIIEDQSLLFEDYPVIKVHQETEITWLLEDMATLSCEADQVIILHLAIDVWKNTGCTPQYVKHFHTVTKDNAVLQEMVQKELGNRLLWNIKRRWNAYCYKHGLYILRSTFPHHLRSKWQKLRERWRHLHNWFWLIRHQQGLRSGKEWYALIFLIDKAKHSNSMKRGTADWQSLEAIYGRTIAHAAREGWKTFWKTFEPQLPHEKKEANRIDRRVKLGLTGLNTAVEDGLKMKALSPQEAKFATAYAVNKLNGFSEWFAELAGTTHKRVVQEVLHSCIQAEWKISAEQPHISVLSKLTYAAPSLQAMVADEVFSLLLQEDPAHHDVLTQALELAFDSFREEHLNALIPVADQRLQNLASDNSSFMTWLITWLHIEGMGATAFLKNFLATAPSHSHAVMERLCATLSGHRPNYPRCKNPAYLQPRVMEQFIPLVYRYVRPADDLKHEEGRVYSPIPRDEAQDFRNALLPRLAESTEPEAYVALQHLMEEPLLTDEREWIFKLLADQRERAAEDVPWEPQDIAEFAQCYETTPRSAHSLFNLILKRFIQIQDEVQCADFSMRNVFRSGDLEKELRVFLGQRLKELSQEHYTVVQEAEVDAGKKPDLRVVVTGLPIMIEIKLAHKWSYTELKKALTEQLVGLYLRSQDSRHGILVIGKNEEKNEWRDQDKNQSFNFKELIDDLNKQANEILKNRSDIDGLKVIGIDFSKPDL